MSYADGSSPAQYVRANRRARVGQPIYAAGDVQYEPIAGNQSYAISEGSYTPGCDVDCGDGCGIMEGSYECGSLCNCDANCFQSRWPRVFDIFAGATAFRGPRDRGLSANFGFTEGLNFGAQLGDPWGCGFQIGASAVQADFYGYKVQEDGSTATATLTGDRHQYFVTAGFFRRAEVGCVQWGVVFDYMFDTYQEDSSLKQIRTESGWLVTETFEIGYSGAYHISTDSITFGRTIDCQLESTDQFIAYVRSYFSRGGEGRLWGGVTGYGDGLLGADCWVPLGERIALQNSFNYLLPKQGKGEAGGQVQESWGFALNLVWYPGRSTECVSKSAYRPVLNVADNSQFMVRQRVTPAPQ